MSVIPHYRFAEGKIAASAEVLKRRRTLIGVVILEVLDYLDVGVHRHVLLQVVLVPAETLRAQHVLRYAVYHHREAVMDTPVLDFLRRLSPLRYLCREVVLVEIDVPRFAAGPLRKPALNDNFLALLFRLRLFVDYVFIHVLFHFIT